MGGSSWKTFCGGGSGYTFNRATLKLLVEKLLPRCGVRLRTSQEGTPSSPFKDVFAGCVSHICYEHTHVYRYHGGKLLSPLQPTMPLQRYTR